MGDSGEAMIWSVTFVNRTIKLTTKFITSKIYNIKLENMFYDTK